MVSLQWIGTELNQPRNTYNMNNNTRVNSWRVHCFTLCHENFTSFKISPKQLYTKPYFLPGLLDCLSDVVNWIIKLVTVRLHHMSTRKPSWRMGYARQRHHSKMAVSHHLGHYRTGNSAIWSADPENLTLEANITSISKTVAKLWPFLYIQDGRQPPSWILSNHK